MEKLILERDREDFYILEVNDKGDTIEFDLTDIELPNKIIKASEKLAKIDKEYMNNLSELLKEKDEVIQTKKAIELEKNKCIEMREIFDSFLGEGACQKIFGDKNYYSMFVQLFDALEPHFDKMKIKLDKAKLKLANKYLNNNNGVI